MLVALLWFAAGLSLSAGFAACGEAQPVLSETASAIAALNEQIAGAQSFSSAPALTPRIAGPQQPQSRSTAALLQTRAGLLRELMTTHPEEVRSVMLPASVAATLLAADPGSAAYLEHEATLAGDLGTVEIDDFSHGAGQRVYVLHDRSTATHVALHAAASLSLQPWLHMPLEVRGVQLGSDLLAEAAAPNRPEPAVSLGQAAAAVTPSNISLTCSTTGQQRTAVVLLQFPNNTPAFPPMYSTAGWWQQAITGSGDSVNSLWSEMTGGSTYASVDVYGPVTLPQRYGCADYLALRSAALTLAGNTIDLSRYTRIVLGFPAANCAFGGLADVGCNAADAVVPHPYSVVWLPILTTYTAATGAWASLAHELGHNLGLNHANTLDFGPLALGPIDFQATNPGVVGGIGATTAAGAVTAIDTEYGDVFSVMGNPWTHGPGPYSAEHRAELLGWIPASGSSNGLGTVMTPGTYTLQAAGAGSGVRALRVLRDPASASWIWVEYRDGRAPFDAANLASILGENATRGATIHYEDGYGNHEKTFQLDMTPTAKGNSFADGALLPGKSWSDPYSPLSLTVDRNTSAGLQISVAYDPACASFSVGTTPVAAGGGGGTVNVTAPPTCAWKASSNAAWMSLTGTTGGTGNGAFTWTAAPNFGTGQRVTYLTVGRTSQRLVQVGSGASVVALSPANASVSVGSNAVLALTLQDPVGVADLRAVTLNATAAGAAPCTVLAKASANGTPFFFLLDPVSGEYTSSLAGGAAGSIRTAGCTLNGTGSGLSVNGGGITFTLDLSFPATSPEVRALYATANTGPELPLGLLQVGMPNPTPTPTAAATTVSVTPSATQLPLGAAATLTVVVQTGKTGGIPTGSVTLQEGTTALSTIALGNGTAVFPLQNLGVGVHTYTVGYGGDANNLPSTSPAVTLTVPKSATTLTLAGTATALPGGAVSLSVAASSVAGVVPTGTVLLQDGSQSLGTVTLKDGSGTLLAGALATGTHTVTASYAGDGNYLGAAAPPVSINVVDFSLEGTSTGIAVKAGAVTGNTATVALTPGSNGFPFLITLTCSGAPAKSSCAISPGQVTPGAAAVPLRISVTTTAPFTRATAVLVQPSLLHRGSRAARLAAWLGLPLALLVSRRKRGMPLPVLVSVLLAFAFTTGISGCGTGVSGIADKGGPAPTAVGGTPSGSSVLTIQAVATANGTTLTHTVTVPLQVN